MTPEPVFLLYANCIPVQGARRSLVCDLQTRKLKFIPNDLYSILIEFRGATLDRIIEHYGEVNRETIREYFSHLVQAGLGFWTDEPEVFPALDLHFDYPARITNAVIDVDGSSRHDYGDLLKQLDALGCHALQLRMLDRLPLQDLEEILTACTNHLLRHMELLLKYDASLTEDALVEVCHRYPFVAQVSVYGCPCEARVDVTPYNSRILYTSAEFTPSSCGHVDPQFFSTTLEHFAEAQRHNTCLHRKLSVCANGEIRACPAMKESVGHTATHRLAAVVDHPHLIQIGNLSKDRISVCRDCEFRYICTDCRAFRQHEEDLYSKPAKCSYDPYTATWQDQPGDRGSLYA